MDLRRKSDPYLTGLLIRLPSETLPHCCRDPEAFQWSCDQFYDRYKNSSIEKVVGIDARGFLFGAVLAYKLDVGFTPVRKKGKLPPPVISQEYTLEYGTNTVEISEGGIRRGEKVVIIDDLPCHGWNGISSCAAG
jgi:adenine phosphoribosyltransferase